ncbi:MAG: DoxX family protein [Planctomycetota bacterium]
MVDRIGSGVKDYAPFALRIGLALIFILEGARDLADGPAKLEPILIALVEILGGLFALIGFLARSAGAALMALSAWTICYGPGLRVLTEWDQQLPLAAVFMSFALFALGGGKWSIDERAKKKE